MSKDDKEFKTVGYVYPLRNDGKPFDGGFKRLIVTIEGTRYYMGIMPSQHKKKETDASHYVVFDGYTQKAQETSGGPAPKKATEAKKKSEDFFDDL